MAVAPSPASGEAADLPVVVRPLFPAEVVVGDTGVPATIELSSVALLPVFVTAVSLRPACAGPPVGLGCDPSGNLVLGSTARGVGNACPSSTFAILGPDPDGTYLVEASPPILFLPVADLFRPTCTIHITFDAVRAGPAVYQLATVTGFTIPPVPHTVSGVSVTSVRPMPVGISVMPSTFATPAGRPVSTSVTLSSTSDGVGLPPPGGTLSFTLFGPDDDGCEGRPVFGPVERSADTGTVVGPEFTPTAAGTYRWLVRYSGDTDHEAGDSGCTAATQILPAPRPVASSTSTSPTTTSPPTTSPAPTSPPPITVAPAPAAPTGEESRSAAPGVYDVAANADDVVAVQVSAFAILALLGGGATGRAGRAKGSAGDRQAGELVVTEVESAEEGLEGRTYDPTSHMRGDVSHSWQWPGTLLLDRASRRWPERIAHRSPFTARLLNDAGYLRAMFGSASTLLLATGIVLGVLAVRDVGGEALPPQFWLAMALAVLGVLDALAGVLAVGVFIAGVILAGGLSSADAARTLLGVATLWFAAPLIAGTARPLRRPPTMSFEQHFDRTGDVVIASLVGAWAVQKILQGLPGLSGLDLPIAARANTAALVVLGALGVRLLLETIAAHWYPQRLLLVQPRHLPSPSTTQRVVANLLIVALFLFVSVSFLGSCWQLYVGGAIFVLPRLLQLVEHRLPNIPTVHRMTPRGIVAIVLLLIVGVVLTSVVLGHLEDGRQLIRDSFVILSLPGLALAIFDLIGRDGPDYELRWQQQLWGIPLIALGILLALGIVG